MATQNVISEIGQMEEGHIFQKISKMPILLQIFSPYQKHSHDCDGHTRTNFW